MEEVLESVYTKEDEEELEKKAIKIKGKSYVLVSDRIKKFNEVYVNGSITTELISSPDSEMVVMRATVVPDMSTNCDRKFTGYSQAKWSDGMVNKTSALENCETSAVGRALAMMGIGVLDSIASADEMAKAGAIKLPEDTGDVVQNLNNRVANGTVSEVCKVCGSNKIPGRNGLPYCRQCWLNSRKAI